MLGNGIKQTTTSSGASGADLTLSSVTGYPTFADVFAVGRLFSYGLLDADGKPIQWGIGHLSDSTTLVQDKVLATYSGGTYDDTSPAAVTLSGTTTVICVAEAGTLAGNPLNVSTSSTTRAIYPDSILPYSAFTFTVAADRCYYVPILINTPRELDAIFFRVSAGAGSSTAKVGIYASTIDGKPGARIEESSSQTTGTGDGGVKKTATLTARRYPPGLYFLAFASNGTPTINSTGSTGAVRALIGADSTGVQAISMLYETLSGGWTSLPATAATSLTEASPGVPVGMSMRVKT